MAQHKEIIDEIKSQENQERIKDDYTRFLIYNGRIRKVIEEAIRKEFELPETVSGLIKRIIPINVSEKIVDKLASVYKQAPLRSARDGDPGDDELIDLYEVPLKINQKMKFANRYFKNCKHTFVEPYLDYRGVPRLRTLSSHMYTPLGYDPNEPERMTAWVKHIKYHQDSKYCRYHYWDDEQFLILDGDGVVVSAEMQAIGNPQGINPYGTIPGVYISESDDGGLIPISDDDLVAMSIVIPLLLTDMAFASKFQLWSILAIIGADAKNITFNPSSILSLPPGADLKVIKPEVDMDKSISLVRELLGMLLTTKNLSVGDVSQINVSSAASGVAKLLDNAETTEDRKDQQAFFEYGEKMLWEKFAHNMLPVWVAENRVHPDYIGAFSDEFELSIKFPDPKPFVGDKERVDLEVVKLDKGLTTRFRSLQVVNPELDDEQIEMLIEEIGKEKKEAVQSAMQAMVEQSAPEEETEVEDGDVQA